MSRFRKFQKSGDLAYRLESIKALETYLYYKWQSHDPIFATKEGKPSGHKYIGKAGSFAFTKAVDLMMGRPKQNYSNHFIRLN